jgi:formylglycine-generating enzyme required for sulfatase activity
MKTGIIVLTILLASVVAQGASVPAQQRNGASRGGGDQKIDGMMRIPAGTLTSFIRRGADNKVSVKTFYLDIYPVTNLQFLEFVKANPRWARSKVSSLFADAHYLEQWESDFSLGRNFEQLKDRPVTNVSWFAASAYSRWKGKRLPTTNEWEYAGSAERSDRHLTGKTSLAQYILEWYSRPTPPLLPPVGSTFRNRYGIWDMHGLVWEWVSDFNSYVTGGDSRSNTEIERNFFCGAASMNTVNKEDYAAFMRYGYRGSLEGRYTVRNLGFRCALDAK